MGSLEPANENEPGGEIIQSDNFSAPESGLNVPPGQGVGSLCPDLE